MYLCRHARKENEQHKYQLLPGSCIQPRAGNFWKGARHLASPSDGGWKYGVYMVCTTSKVSKHDILPTKEAISGRIAGSKRSCPEQAALFA